LFLTWCTGHSDAWISAGIVYRHRAAVVDRPDVDLTTVMTEFSRKLENIMREQTGEHVKEVDPLHMRIIGRLCR